MDLKESMKMLCEDIKWLGLFFAVSFLATGMIIAIRDGNGELARFCIMATIICVVISLVFSLVKNDGR